MRLIHLETFARFIFSSIAALKMNKKCSFTSCKLGNCSCITLPTAIHGLVRFLIYFCLAYMEVGKGREQERKLCPEEKSISCKGLKLFTRFSMNNYSTSPFKSSFIELYRRLSNSKPAPLDKGLLFSSNTITSIKVPFSTTLILYVFS